MGITNSDHVLVDGKPSTQVSAQDRGLAYGDGLFETLLMTPAGLKLWDLHMQRLQEGCERLDISFPGESILLSDIHSMGEYEQAVIKIIITRGVAGRGYAPTNDNEPSRIVMRLPWLQRDTSTPANLMLCATRLAGQPLLAGIKHLNRLEQVLASREWGNKSLDEGLMLDFSGNIIEGTMSNIFLVKDDTLFTPQIDKCGVKGVQRANVLNIARLIDINTAEQDLHVDKLEEFDEVFITNSIFEIWPVASIDQHSFKPGDITQAIRDQLTAQS